MEPSYGIPVHYTTAYYEDVTYRLSANELRVAMGSDCVVVGASLPRGYEHPVDDDGYVINEFNMKLRQGPVYMEVVAPPPMAHFETPEDVEAFEFPDPLAEGRFDDAAMYIEKYGDEYFVIGDMELTMFDLMHLSVGMEKLLIDMAMGKAYVRGTDRKDKELFVWPSARSWSRWVWTASGPGTTLGARRHAHLAQDVAQVLQRALSRDLCRTKGDQPRPDDHAALRRRGGPHPGRLD